VGRVILVCAVSLAVIALVFAGFDLNGKAEQREQTPPPPESVSVTFNFQDGPNLVFLCWGGSGARVNFYDVQVQSWNEGQPRADVRYGVTTSPCGSALGTGEYMFEPGLYHFAVRACNNAGCSDWAEASPPERYWASVPCNDATGDRCVRPANATAGR
jgi:hypothetical protein